ncbi:MAG: FAD binding domain-containing protein [Rhodobacteraceae bacterium]|nr:FAD binding domain-containing protein [Paracoccaceae bacterium]
MADISFSLNGSPVTLSSIDPHRTLLAWLREDAGLVGTKEGCNEGDCGACTVINVTRDESGPWCEAMNSCILLMPQLHGKSLYTIEGVAGDETLHPVQEAMIAKHGSQCGFCTPGIVMSLVAACENDEMDTDRILAGNLCRCTGYQPIINAARAARPRGHLVPGKTLPAAVSSPDCFLPASLDEFAGWYEENPRATLIAGATDVGLWVTKQFRQLQPACFLGGLDELCEISSSETSLAIGAMVTLNRLHAAIAPVYPSLAAMIERFGSVQVRNNATVGGNIANGSPIGDLAPALIALGCRLRLRRGQSRRELPLEDFFLDYGRQDRQPGEFVESLLIKTNQPALRCYKISKRHDQDISALCGCFNVTLDGDTVRSARLAFGGMAATPKRALATEQALRNQLWTHAAIVAARNALDEDFRPISDMRASHTYRMDAARNLLEKYHLETAVPDVATSVFAPNLLT